MRFVIWDETDLHAALLGIDGEIEHSPVVVKIRPTEA
jgi:hypothetical protein